MPDNKHIIAKIIFSDGVPCVTWGRDESCLDYEPEHVKNFFIKNKIRKVACFNDNKKIEKSEIIVNNVTKEYLREAFQKKFCIRPLKNNNTY